jgi:lysozyme
LVPILSALWLAVQIIRFLRGGQARGFFKGDSGSMPKAGIGFAGVVLAASVAFIGPWEGLRLDAYPDALARNIPTVCYGETRGVELGQNYTKAQCDAMLAKGVAEFHAKLSTCLPELPKMPDGVQVAFTSWVYNVGPTAACKSTLVRKARAGDLIGACKQLPRWNRANGRVVRGLSNRRGAERALCLKALA